VPVAVSGAVLHSGNKVTGVAAVGAAGIAFTFTVIAALTFTTIIGLAHKSGAVTVVKLMGLELLHYLFHHLQPYTM
jgi:hypothetical protein